METEKAFWLKLKKQKNVIFLNYRLPALYQLSTLQQAAK